MTEKVGRNDPCPCGSGKKYKNCHYGQEVKKTYTPEGKRKFTAKVISGSSKNQSVFQNFSIPPMPSKSDSYESLKFDEAKEDYKVSDPEAERKREDSSVNPTPMEGTSEQPPEVFEKTKENYEKKD